MTNVFRSPKKYLKKTTKFSNVLINILQHTHNRKKRRFISKELHKKKKIKMQRERERERDRTEI